MDFFTNNLAQSLFVVGLILLVVEVTVLGFSTFVLFFVGLAAMVTGALLYLGILPDNVLSAMFSMGVLTLLAALLLWKPLKRMQSKVSSKKIKSDFIDHRFILKEAVSPTQSPKHHYSGVEWALISDESIAAGTKVEVTEAEVGKLHIKAVESE
ncbi:NfeD family protein [Marinomonas primoryensis]|jgi:membrane protein implicated in regulation of membrane protease activity|uniref:NfeD family protein n=1 Tax=Marinomonas primoryensis TaxID=178399 RepID=A0A859CWJ9_9GAMM|nr:NfeD family protein [Marinomonas primoryensis]QKK81006.1 NfeD superfamily protein [Marinomonas primoryensis]|tara:strand:- start:1618 stop:2079 length:462 start_codon:yes stop_codon:yes gene_type:complete